MTGLSRWRELAKGLIVLGFTWEAVGAIVGLGVLIFATVGGGLSLTPDRLINVVGTLGLAGVVLWAILDARRRTRRPPVGRVASEEER